ncbi:MAG TPA: acyl-CoA thioesterase [Candidatus Thermoplasmatota archaeon]|nr:acyl-CoA thioesterase [Candidatus Thermoplasmatota archaeon]
MDRLAPKPVSASKSELTEQVLPGEANPLGYLLGGRVMHLMDIACAMAALRHCRRPVVTVSVDKLDFRHPVKIGHFIILKSSVNFTGKTSMEVGVKVESEDPLTGERWHTSSAYFTFVALNQFGKPTPIPAVVPQTPEEKRRFAEGKARYEARRAERELRTAARGTGGSGELPPRGKRRGR